MSLVHLLSFRNFLWLWIVMSSVLESGSDVAQQAKAFSANPKDWGSIPWGRVEERVFRTSLVLLSRVPPVRSTEKTVGNSRLHSQGFSILFACFTSLRIKPRVSRMLGNHSNTELANTFITFFKFRGSLWIYHLSTSASIIYGMTDLLYKAKQYWKRRRIYVVKWAETKPCLFFSLLKQGLTM